MRGCYSGIQTRIRAGNVLTIYVHCYAHILNLCVVDIGCQILHLRNTFRVLSSLHNFIGASAKQNAVFEIVTAEASRNENEKVKGPKTLKSSSRLTKDIIDEYSNRFYYSDIKLGGTPLPWAESPEIIEVFIEKRYNVNIKNILTSHLFCQLHC